MGATVTPSERRLDHVDPYVWIQIVRRARFGGIIAGSGRTGKDSKPTRGGVTGLTFMAVALCFATYAGRDGGNVWPGDAAIAVDLETSIKVVKQVRDKLVELGLLMFVRGPRGDRGSEHRLTLPDDLDDHIEVLTPAQHRLQAKRLRDEARGKPAGTTRDTSAGGSGGPPDDGPLSTGGGSGGPPGDVVAGSPVDHPDGDAEVSRAGPPDHPPERSGWSTGPRSGGPVDPHKNQEEPTNTNHPGDDPRTDVAVVRANAPDQDPIRLGSDPAETEPTGPGEPAGPAPPRAGPVPAEPAGPITTAAGPITTARAAELKERGEPVPRCPHGMHDVVRVSDGRHCCPACRRSLPADPPSAAAQAAARPPGGRTLQPSPAVAHRAAQAAGTPGRSNVLPFRRPPRSRRKEPA